MVNTRDRDNEPLTVLLEESFRSPRCIPLQGPLKRSGVLALCLHCLMIKAGFRTAEDKSSRPRFSRLGNLLGRKSSYTPPPSWLCLLPSTEFIFRWAQQWENPSAWPRKAPSALNALGLPPMDRGMPASGQWAAIEVWLAIGHH